MAQQLFLMATLIILSASSIQANPPKAAGPDKHSSRKVKEDTNNLSVYMRGAYVLAITYTNCEGQTLTETTSAGRSMNRCAKVGTRVKARVSGGISIIIDPHPTLPPPDPDSEDDNIIVPVTGITMGCSGDALFTPKCDASSPYKMQ